MARTIRIDIDGTNKVIKTLQEAKVRASDLKDAWQAIGAKVKNDAFVLAPVLTGRLARSIRNSRGKTRATVRAGNNRMPPYAGVIHYGGYNNITAQPFLTTALHRNAGFASTRVESEIQEIIRQLDLGTFRV